MQSSELEYIERTPETPLTCRIVSIENSSPHWHHEYEIFFVMRGGVTVFSQGAEVRMKAGDIILLNACEIHSISQPEADNLCIVLQFHPDVLAEVYVQSSFFFELNTHLNINIPGDVCDMFRRILAQIGLLIYEQPNGYQFFIKSRLYDLIGLMFKHLRYQVGKETQHPDDIRLQDFDAIKEYIKQRFAQEINLDQMCRELAISRAKLYRVLKEAGTESYKSLVNYYRVENAKGLLRNTDSSISYISAASGFESDSSFYRVFRELTAMTPGQYREIPKGGYVPVGVQGYAGFSKPQALALLREYSGKDC